MGETIRDGGQPFSWIQYENGENIAAMATDSDARSGYKTDSNPNGAPTGGKEDGCISGNVFGTYVHGVFDTEEMQHAIRDFLAERKGVRPETYENGETFSMAKYKEEQYDKMAKIIRENLDMDMIYRILERKDVR